MVQEFPMKSSNILRNTKYRWNVFGASPLVQRKRCT
uniref:Uncharacterized protein n=1 Tax=Tetranychus urticae TaxID=32264 RepID=T1K2D1_TETUR